MTATRSSRVKLLNSIVILLFCLNLLLFRPSFFVANPGTDPRSEPQSDLQSDPLNGPMYGFIHGPIQSPPLTDGCLAPLVDVK